jgi:hypothetical protein
MRKSIQSILLVGVLLSSGCASVMPLTSIHTPEPTINPISLIPIVEASNPNSTGYDPTSKAYAEFPDVINQIVASGDKRDELAAELALAIYFPRPDAYLAGQALITFGPDTASLSLPLLIGSLPNSNPQARAVTLIVLGTIGKRASCAIGHIGPLLWDADPSTRTAAAWALEKITYKKFISDEYEKSINPLELKSITPDLPEGKIVVDAQTWWTEQGSKVNWHPSYGACDP